MVGGIIAKKEVYLTMLARLKNVTKVGERMSEELKPCPFCGHSIDIEKDVYEPSMDWQPTFIDPDSGGDPINIHCKCGLKFCTGTYDWGEFVEAWNRRVNDGKVN